MAYVLSNEELKIINNDPMTFLRNLTNVNDEYIILPIFMYIMDHKFILDLNTIVDKGDNNFLHILCGKHFTHRDILINLIIYILENNYVDVNSVNKYRQTFLHKLSHNREKVLSYIIRFIIKNNLMDVSTENNHWHNFLWCLYNKSNFKDEFIDTINCIKDNELESVYFYCDSSKCLIHEIFNEIDKNALCDKDKELYNYLLEEYNKTSSLTKSSKKNSILDI